MAGNIPIPKPHTSPQRALLHRLTRLTKQISRGNYRQAKKLFDLTVPSAYPQSIAELAEAFGMMIVKCESREFELEQVVEKLERSCKKLSAAQKQLSLLNRNLERKVQDRTTQLQGKNKELNEALRNLKQENKERTQAEKNLRQLYKQIEVTNQELQDAYVRMRSRKDQWEALKYQESIIFLTTVEGRILGFTEKALEMSQQSRSALQEGNIQDVLIPLGGRAFTDLLRKVRPTMSQLVTVRFQNQTEGVTAYDAKLANVAVEGKRLTYIVLYPQQEQSKCTSVEKTQNTAR